METSIKTKILKRSNQKSESFEDFEKKINLPDVKISDDEIITEVKKIRYAVKK